MSRQYRAIIFGFALLATTGAATAQSLPQPTGPVVLTISGNIANSNGDDGAARLDMVMIEALEQRETLTQTPWHNGEQHFSGPTLEALLELVGAEGTSLRIGALNDYAASMPISDTNDYPVILATRQGGAPMSVRDKGPLFVIYPFSEMPELFNEVHFSRSVWHVESIHVEE